MKIPEDDNSNGVNVVGVFIVNFKHISHHNLVFLLLTLNMQLRPRIANVLIPVETAPHFSSASTKTNYCDLSK